MDVLSDVLRVVRLSGAVFFTAEFSSPWTIESPSADLLTSVMLPDADCLTLFHILLEGDCLVECDGHPPAAMRAGDVIVFPPWRTTHNAQQHGGQTSATRLPLFTRPGRRVAPGVAWRRRFQDSLHLWIPELRPTLWPVVPRAADHAAGAEPRWRRRGRSHRSARHAARPVPQESGTWLRTTLRFAANEASAARPGNAAMLGRLTELMFVEIIREYMHQLPVEQDGWLAGLRDPFVGKALRLLHAQPERNWTVDDLSHEVALSRSAVAQRFTLVIGEAAMRYLANWRVELGKEMLRDRQHSVSAIAVGVGYESEAAFNCAFKRARPASRRRPAIPPATWRRAAVRRTSPASVGRTEVLEGPPLPTARRSRHFDA